MIHETNSILRVRPLQYEAVSFSIFEADFRAYVDIKPRIPERCVEYSRKAR